MKCESVIISGIKDLLSKRPRNVEGMDRVDNSILLSILYLSHNVNEKGRFVYRNNLNLKKKYSTKIYSSIRHAGTLYSMLLCERLFESTVLTNKRLLASEFLQKNYLKRVGTGMYGIVSKPVEESEVLVATSGGTGLGLVALSNLLPMDKIRLVTLRKMGNFLLYLQGSNGEFWSCYEFGKHDRSMAHFARYYQGEACLGLLYLNEVDKDAKWVKAARKGLIRAAKNTEKIPEVDMKFDHWCMIALEKLYATPENKLKPDDLKLLSHFVAKNVKGIILKQDLDKKSETYGTFDGVKSICGMSTIMEGLCAAYNCLEDKGLKNKILKSLDAVSEYISKNQIQGGPNEGGIPANASWKLATAKNDDKEIRIDYVQHAMSGWLNYKKILSNR